jgi:uncharacterized protein
VFEIRKARRGFASMSAEKQREIASKGGRAAHAKGTAHEWSAEEARRAGRKGGQASRGGRGKLPTVAEQQKLKGKTKKEKHQGARSDPLRVPAGFSFFLFL